jgi:signal transduction histidine kinase
LSNEITTDRTELGLPFSAEGETKLVHGEKEVLALAYGFIERATESYIYSVTDRRIPKDTATTLEFTRNLMETKSSFKIRVIADLQEENLNYYKELMKMGVELRHIEGNKVNFAISKGEYLAAPLGAIERQVASGAAVPAEIFWSNRKDVVSQFDQVFKMMWDNAVRAEARIKEIEEGTEPEGTILIEDLERVYSLGKRMNDECKEEALMIFASDKTVTRNRVMFENLARRQKDLGFKIKILTPKLDSALTAILPSAEWKEMQHPINVSIMIYDRRRMFITQYLDPEASTTENAVAMNIYSTSIPTIASIISMFSSLWEETRLRERERRSRLQAELLQDVLTHDIRNYNQISKMGTEVLLDRVSDDPIFHGIAKSVLEAIDGSTSLVDKAKKLGRIIAEQGRVKLHSVDLIQSIDRSLLLVKQLYPDKRIKETRKVVRLQDAHGQEPMVLADELMDEVFVNLFSNSIKFCTEDKVTIDISIEEKKSASADSIPQTDPIGPLSDHFWEVTIADSGPGIPSEQRTNIFQRYSKGQKASGLGLSIVHELVVGRYGGSVSVDDDDGTSDKKKGAIFKLSLRQPSTARMS